VEEFRRLGVYVDAWVAVLRDAGRCALGGQGWERWRSEGV